MAVFTFPPINVSTSAPVGGATSAKQDTQITQETAINTVLGLQADAVATTDTGTFSIVAFVKRSMQNWTSLLAKLPALVSGRIPVDGSGVTQPVSGTVTANAGTNLNTSALALETTQTTQNTLIGIVTETAPASDTASSGLNGRLQRVAQRITSLIALLPASLGTKAAASSLATTWSTEDEALVGALIETAPASDTASSGLNGRLQRIAQRLTSLIALFPTALGQSTMANSFRVVLASDQSAIATTTTPAVTAGTVTNAQVNLPTAGTAVRATVSGSAPNAARKLLLIKPSINNTTGRVWFGASTVSALNGMEIVGPDRVEFDFDAGDYWIVSDTNNFVVEVMEKV